MEQEKDSKTYTSIIIDRFKEHGAVSQNNSITIEELGLPYAKKVTEYFLENLMEGDFVKETSKGFYWFNNTKWEKELKKTSLQYSLILFTPIALSLLCYVLLK